MPVDTKTAEQPDDLVAQGGEFRTLFKRLVAGSSAQLAIVDANGILALVSQTQRLP